MLNTYFLLFYEYFKVGLFTIGGGYASLPFLYHMAENYDWFSIDELTQMIAVSGLTPGPIGLNMATFAGFKALGIFGSLVATVALVLPMMLITTQVFRFYLKFSESKCTKSILYVLRPTSCALISSVGLRLFYNLILEDDITFHQVDIAGLILFIVLFLMTFKLSRNPIIYMFIAGLIGVIVKFC